MYQILLAICIIIAMVMPVMAEKTCSSVELSLEPVKNRADVFRLTATPSMCKCLKANRACHCSSSRGCQKKEDFEKRPEGSDTCVLEPDAAVSVQGLLTCGCAESLNGCQCVRLRGACKCAIQEAQATYLAEQITRKLLEEYPMVDITQATWAHKKSDKVNLYSLTRQEQAVNSAMTKIKIREAAKANAKRTSLAKQSAYVALGTAGLIGTVGLADAVHKYQHLSAEEKAAKKEELKKTVYDIKNSVFGAPKPVAAAA